MNANDSDLVFEIVKRLEFPAGECEELILKLWDQVILYSDYGYGCDAKINDRHKKFIEHLRNKLECA